MVRLAISGKGKLEQGPKKVTEGGCSYLVKKITREAVCEKALRGSVLGLSGGRKSKKAHPVVEKGGGVVERLRRDHLGLFWPL